MESQTLTILFWILIFVVSNIALILLFGRSIQNLVIAITAGLKDGYLTDEEIERIAESTSAVAKVSKKLYKAVFMRG